ncbi:Permease family protein [Desulfacinum hydrothermale DSM 13146]|uniref:Permease family protein n=1 Tax=Desulfacinum hydrothermale DSM 13146 TaxID=1121390 RepID=A0A1W1XIZ0_9BACT|nr:solute carrier family 23 protein [Desulfacinum hydrothermale]SMC23946.1 Permease family protein [Desulfacinum hydrothermale DSM 13146]
MAQPGYLYDLDEHPPLLHALLYGLQWAMIVFPALIVTGKIAAQGYHLSTAEQVRFLQLTLLTAGFFTGLQTLFGHRYPLFEGPSTANLLTYISLAPLGLQAVQGGASLAALSLVIVVAAGLTRHLLRLFTANVIAVILMLIALALLPHLIPAMVGASSPEGGGGDGGVLAMSLGLTLLMAYLGHRLRGLWKTFSLAMGMAVGTALFGLWGKASLTPLRTAHWIAIPSPWLPESPAWNLSAFLAFLVTYVAILVNSVGSVQGMSAITTGAAVETRLKRGLFFNGISGICCGLLGLVGTVCYSTGPGVVLASRVASRYALTYCGLLLVLAAFIPKFTALLALPPPAVVAAAMVVAMGGQVGAGISLICQKGPLESRDYFIVGIPLLVGTMAAFLPVGFVRSLPGLARVIMGNGLVMGIFLVLLLEHVLIPARQGEQTS